MITRLSRRIQVEKVKKETHRKEHENCFICHTYLGPFRNPLKDPSDETDIPIAEQLETLINAHVSRKAKKHSSVCQDCFFKLSKYNRLQREAFEIQQSLFLLYNGHHTSDIGEFVSVKIEDQSEEKSQPAVRLNCQKCFKVFASLHEMAAHRECRRMKIDHTKISNEFMQQAGDAGIDYDYTKFQEAFFSKHEQEVVRKPLPKRPPPPPPAKRLNEKISRDFKRLAASKGITYDIDTFHRAFGGDGDEESEKPRTKKIPKRARGISRNFIKELSSNGIDYSLELFQKVFGYSDNIDYHRKLYKLDNGDGDGSSSSVKCKHCGETFTSRSKFVQHMRTHKTREFYCEECEKEFRTKVCLVIHHATDHERRKVGPFECPICFKPYNDRTALRTHYYIHIGDRSFLCGICGADFFHKKSFEMHSLMHEDIRPFECDTCHKAFRTKGKLTIHLRVHTGEKIYECPYCPGKRFAQKYGMDLHIKKTHMNMTQSYTEQCTICGMKLQNKSKLRQHLANAHQVADDGEQASGSASANEYAMM